MTIFWVFAPLFVFANLQSLGILPQTSSDFCSKVVSSELYSSFKYEILIKHILHNYFQI